MFGRSLQARCEPHSVALRERLRQSGAVEQQCPCGAVRWQPRAPAVKLTVHAQLGPVADDGDIIARVKVFRRRLSLDGLRAPPPPRGHLEQPVLDQMGHPALQQHTASLSCEGSDGCRLCQGSCPAARHSAVAILFRVLRSAQTQCFGPADRTSVRMAIYRRSSGHRCGSCPPTRCR